MTQLQDSTTPQLTYLPSDYIPTERDVVIGKGKRFYHHGGNVWLRQIVGQRITAYRNASLRSDKSRIISSVVDYIQQNGRFIRLDTTSTSSTQKDQAQRWVLAEPLLSREKCSQTFRDYLAETYKSSNIAKRNKRRQEQMERNHGIVIHQDNVSGSSNKKRKTTPTTSAVLSSSSAPPPAALVPQVTQEGFCPISSSSSSSLFNNASTVVAADDDSSGCATWFDWDQPLENLLGDDEDSFQDHSQNMLSFPHMTTTMMMEPTPLPSTSSTSSPPFVVASTSNFNDNNNNFTIGNYDAPSSSFFQQQQHQNQQKATTTNMMMMKMLKMGLELEQQGGGPLRNGTTTTALAPAGGGMVGITSSDTMFEPPSRRFSAVAFAA